jgi:predicted enzyme related to lactoylglutathione lyase
MANPFVHIELTTDDLGKAKEFYGALFKWSLEDMPMPDGTYTMVKAEGGPGGGMMKKPSPEVPTAWLAYVEVDSVVATVAKAKTLGAKIVRDNTPIPGMGAFAILLDPTGGAIGVWETTKKK